MLKSKYVARNSLVGPAGKTALIHDAQQHRESPVDLVVILRRQRDLLEIVAALRSPGRLPRRLDGRKQQGDQDGNDRDHHQELDQREPPSPVRSWLVLSSKRQESQLKRRRIALSGRGLGQSDSMDTVGLLIVVLERERWDRAAARQGRFEARASEQRRLRDPSSADGAQARSRTFPASG